MNYRTSFPKIIAHQGLCVNGNKNTIPAFKAAKDAEIEMIEMDVHETRDGHFMVFHDDALHPGLPSWNQLTYAQVQALTAGDDRAPKLEDCLNAIGSLAVNIEIKHCRSVTSLVRTLSASKPPPGSVVSSFNYALLKQMHAAGVQLPLLLLVSLDRRQTLTQNLRNASICIAPYFLPKFLDGLAVHYMLAHKTMIKILQPKGVTVFVWTVDDPNQMRKFISLDVDGIVTNDPQQLQALKAETNINYAI